MKDSIHRLLTVPKRSFLLFGPRGTGKSTWLRQLFPNSLYIDLLKSSTFLELQSHPEHLEAMTAFLDENEWVVIDEIQKVPELLDEVHRLIENNNIRFALSGSSARKLKRSGVNLLAGRAVTRKFFPFSYAELRGDFDFMFSLEWGMLPLLQMYKDEAVDILDAYFNTYIAEEIRAEGTIRKLAPFIRFLEVAGMLNGETINALNISRDASVPRSSVDSYFSILQDTLLADFLPAYRPNLKVREQTHPKLFWFDSGVARAAAGLLYEPSDKLWLGKSLETLILHELKCYNSFSEKKHPLFYYRTAAGSEIDFIVQTQKRRLNIPAEVVCIEVKLSDKWQRKWEKSIKSFAESKKINVKKMVGIYTGKEQYNFDGFQVLPVETFLQKLHAGEIF